MAVNETIQLPTEVKATILDDRFWIMVDQCVSILKPITEAIFQLEGNEYNINKVFMVFKDIQSKVEKELLITAIQKRTAMVIKPIHYAAYMLDPTTTGLELNQNQEIEAMEFINDLANSLNIDCLADLAHYRGQGGLWSKPFTWKAAETVEPVMWWKGICALSKISLRILTAPCTSSATERSFSTQSFIHSVKRNRLTTGRAAKISYLAYNWNLINKSDENLLDILSDDVTTESDGSFEENDLETTTEENDLLMDPQPSTSQTQPLEFIQINPLNFNSDDSCSD